MELSISRPDDLFTYRPVAFFNDTESSLLSSPSLVSGRQRLDLNLHCIKRPDDTFFVRISGLSMVDSGIRPGDILVVDRILAPKKGDLVVMMEQGEVVVYELQVKPELKLLSLSADHADRVDMENLSELQRMGQVGIVTSIIHHIRQ
ncbi:LexA family protein [Plesiomonas shigelloides]|uniref:LexA family protein n=1 Tax=Plesiomonas shigelloides TaxID=703 RepID=UPI003EBC33BC